VKIQKEPKQVKLEAGSDHYVLVIKDDLTHFLELLPCTIANFNMPFSTSIIDIELFKDMKL